MFVKLRQYYHSPSYFVFNADLFLLCIKVLVIIIHTLTCYPTSTAASVKSIFYFSFICSKFFFTFIFTIRKFNSWHFQSYKYCYFL